MTAGPERGVEADMKLTSEAMPDGQIPVRYSKDGQNVSPPLAWSDLPAGTEELALLFENITPQSKEPFVQWVVYKIPPDQGGLPEGYRRKRGPKEPVDVLHGRNALGNVGYDVPSAPSTGASAIASGCSPWTSARAVPRPRQESVPRSGLRPCDRAERSDRQLRARSVAPGQRLAERARPAHARLAVISTGTMYMRFWPLCRAAARNRMSDWPWAIACESAC